MYIFVGLLSFSAVCLLLTLMRSKENEKALKKEIRRIWLLQRREALTLYVELKKMGLPDVFINENIEEILINYDKYLRRYKK